MDNELVTLAQAQKMLGYASRTSMYLLFHNGELEPIRINPVKQKQPVYIRRRDVERFIQRRMAIAS